MSLDSRWEDGAVCFYTISNCKFKNRINNNTEDFKDSCTIETRGFFLKKMFLFF